MNTRNEAIRFMEANVGANSTPTQLAEHAAWALDIDVGEHPDDHWLYAEAMQTWEAWENGDCYADSPQDLEEDREPHLGPDYWRNEAGEPRLG